ncbi:hypothetical protein OAK91_03685, partial [Planctomycetaceae bacterium]|nr:hypothetical protein [Planctomycetaceae bacterium]
GETIWKGAGFNYGGFCVLTQDDRLVVLGNRGKMRLIDTVDHQQTEYRELALKKTLTQDDIWSQVVINNGYILCKDVRGRILCLKIGE